MPHEGEPECPSCGVVGDEVERGGRVDPWYRHCDEPECRVRLYTPYPEKFQ